MTHAELVAAVEKERAKVDDHYRLLGDLMAKTRRSHLTTLAAILDLHTILHGDGEEWCVECGRFTPCPTLDVVADALRKMGAL